MWEIRGGIFAGSSSSSSSFSSSRFSSSDRVANLSERKNTIFSEKMPQVGFYYIRTSEKMPHTQKWGIFPHAFLLTMENALWLKKCHY